MITRPTVAVIGAGPGGLFFCHAMEGRRQERIAATPVDDYDDDFPVVTCFESASAPGGVWRASNSSSMEDDGTTATANMYAALWTNGPSHATEFYDYTYDEHFKQPVTVYMKRQDLLTYIQARVTNKCPDFWDRYVKFRHEVMQVRYNEEERRFHITVKNLITNIATVQQFDKCVWACGDNGLPNMPAKTLALFSDGGFTGRILHSSDSHNLKNDVAGKRVLMIGGRYSAEDLALQAIKLGAQHIYIASRDKGPEVSWMRAWPGNKVSLLLGQAPSKVTEGGNCIQFRKIYPAFPYNYRFYDGVETSVRNIDTIFFCTGYKVRTDMLDESLQTDFPGSNYDHSFTLPTDWKMQPNALTHLVGHVSPEELRYQTSSIHPDFYHGVRIDNPNFFMLPTYGSSFPILAADIFGWLMAGFVSGAVPLPSAEEMRERIRKQLLHEMNMIYTRYLLDEEYRSKIGNLPNFWDKDDSNPIYTEAEAEYYIYLMRITAAAAHEGQYPVDFGNFDKLSSTAELIMKFDTLSYKHRENVGSKLFAGQDSKSKRNRQKETFRDCHDTDNFFSIFTGTKAVPLPKLWMDLDADESGIE